MAFRNKNNSNLFFCFDLLFLLKYDENYFYFHTQTKFLKQNIYFCINKRYF